MKSVVTTVNAGLAFALEMGMLAALCWWGIRTGRGAVSKTLLAGGSVAAGITVWAVFLAAGGHAVELPKVVEAGVKLGVFFVAAVVLGVCGHRWWGVGFGVLAVVSVVVEYGVGT
ncbi:hypothetical protein GCM10009839_73800 [Catenulispora yoronensis]|uniref:DUF2568 domain-containing protein n=1 Tax=Catenulispora yoronensis TaxID=450799 RepID=A0ABN2V7R0_9ACTN